MKFRPHYSSTSEKDKALYIQCPPEPVIAALFYPVGDGSPGVQIEPVLFCQCLYGEARGEGSKGIQAVAQVIMNRWLRQEDQFGFTPREVLLKHSQQGVYQFSCMSMNDRNFALLQKPEWVGWLKCFKAGMDYYFHPRPLTADSSYFYINNKIPLPAFFKKLRKVNSIGNHDFYSDL